MNNRFLINNRNEFLIFFILFIVSLSFTIYQFTAWESSTEQLKWHSLALFSGDEPFYLEITSTLVHHNSLNAADFYTNPHSDQSLIFPDVFYEANSCRLHHSLLGRDGNCWSGHHPGLSFLLVPGYAIGGVIGAMITMNVLFATQGIVIYKFLSHFVNRISSLLVSLFFGLTTMDLSFSDRIYPDMVAGFFVLLSLYFFFIKKNNTLNISIVGAILGFLPILKLEFIVFSIFILPIMIVALFKKNTKNQIITLLSVYVFFILALLWYLVISAPIEDTPGVAGAYAWTAKQAISEKAGQYLEFMTKGFGNLLFGRSYGLFTFSPIALLSIFGMKYVWNRDKMLAIAITTVMFLFILGLSLTIPYAAGWSLPSRYVLPILPLSAIPFAFLFQNFVKKIPFQLLVLFTSFIGTSFNILFVRIIYSHPTVEMRASIANQAYLGTAQIFPYVGVSTDPLAITNFWSSSGPFFWIFIIIITSLFFIFTLYSKIKTYVTALKRKDKILLFSIVFAFLAPGIIYAYEAVNEYLVEIQITELYHKILGRSPDPEGLVHWKNIVLHEGKSIDWVEEMMYKSPEGVATTKITSFYNDILHRSPDPDGLSRWKNAILIDGKSYDWVEEMIKNSPEAQGLQK